MDYVEDLFTTEIDVDKAISENLEVYSSLVIIDLQLKIK